MSSPGQQSLSNFYESVKFSDPLKASLMSEDIVSVALNSLTEDKSNGQKAANRLREQSRDLPVAMQRVLENALSDLGYE